MKRKKILSVLWLSSLLLFLFSCDNKRSQRDNDTKEQLPATAFNQEKANVYGADEFGMRKYVMAFLYKGPNRDLDSTRASELQMAHLKNIRLMAEKGQLSLAGPFLDNGELRGIYVFNVPTIEEAKTLVETDPAIQAGSLRMELKEWYGSAALMAVNEIHPTLAKKNITN